MRFDDGADNTLDAVELVVHGIFEGRGNVFVTFPADSSTILFGRIFYHALVGLILIIDILPFVAVNTADLTMI